MPQPSSSSAAPAKIWVELGSRTHARISVALFLAGFATFSLIYCIQPLLPAVAGHYRISAAESSLSLSLTTGFLAIAILCAGAVSESLGRKGLMAVSILGGSVLNMAAAIAPNWHTLLIARAVEGVVVGGVPAVAMAYLAEEIHPKGLGKAMGLYVAGTACGGMSGRVVCGILADLSSWQMAMGLTGLLCLISGLGFWLLLPPSRNFVRRPGLGVAQHVDLWLGHLRRPGLPWLFGVGFVSMGGFVTVYNYLGFRLQAPPFSLSHSQIGLIFTAYVFGMIASQQAGGLADRLGRGPVLMAGAVIALVGLGLTLMDDLLAVIAGVVLVTSGFFMTHSVASGWVGRLATEAKGHASSLYLLAYYLGSSLMGSSGGWVWAWGHWPAVAAFTAMLFLVALLAGRHVHILEKSP